MCDRDLVLLWVNAPTVLWMTICTASEVVRSMRALRKVETPFKSRASGALIPFIDGGPVEQRIDEDTLAIGQDGNPKHGMS